MQSLLEGEYTVHVATSGQQALGLALQHDYAVILLDVRMPEMDGFETAQFLRQNRRTQYTAIIFTSAFDREDAQVRKGYEVGGTDYLFSPIDPDLLKLKLRTYIGMHTVMVAMSADVRKISSLLWSVELALGKSGAKEAALKKRIQELEEAVETLKSDMSFHIHE
jgi:CheY-like chemotaxis protein